MNPSLTEFLSARIAEDEAAAMEATASPWVSRRGPREHVYEELGGTWVADVATREDRRHIARQDPARVLARCAADRLIVEDFVDYASEYRKAPSDFTAGRRHAALLAVTRLVSVYADHPDYRLEWTP